MVAGLVGAEVLRSVLRACPEVAHLDAVVFADRAAQQHWPAGLVGLDAPAPVAPVGERKAAVAAGYSGAVHGASAVEGASVGSLVAWPGLLALQLFAPHSALGCRSALSPEDLHAAAVVVAAVAGAETSYAV